MVELSKIAQSTDIVLIDSSIFTIKNKKSGRTLISAQANDISSLRSNEKYLGMILNALNNSSIFTTPGIFSEIKEYADVVEKMYGFASSYQRNDYYGGSARRNKGKINKSNKKNVKKAKSLENQLELMRSIERELRDRLLDYSKEPFNSLVEMIKLVSRTKGTSLKERNNPNYLDIKAKTTASQYLLSLSGRSSSLLTSSNFHRELLGTYTKILCSKELSPENELLTQSLCDNRFTLYVMQEDGTYLPEFQDNYPPKCSFNTLDDIPPIAKDEIRRLMSRITQTV